MGSYLDQIKTTSPDAYAKIAKLAQYTANDKFGGQIQDYQAQLFTPLSADVVAKANSQEGRIPTEDGYTKDLGQVNGVPVSAVYDSSGKLTGYQGDSRTRSFLDGSNSVSGAWDASGQPNPQKYSSSGGGFFNNLISDLGSGLSGAVKDIASSLKDVAKSPVGQIGLSYFLPGAGAALAAELGVSAAVGTALVSTAAQIANGVSFEDALKNATVNAVVQSGSPAIANDIAKTVGSPGVADAITSGGASIGATLAKGGTMDDALKNATAAIAASGASQFTDSRAIGAAVGGGITGGATGAALGAAGELGRPTTTGGGVNLASAGNITSDTGIVSDSPPTDLGLQEIVGNKDTGIGSTDVQVLDQIRRQNEAAPNAVPIAPVTQPAATPAATELPNVEVSAQRPPTNIANTDVQVLDQIRNQQPTQIPEITITAQRPPATIADTDIQPVTELPPVEITDTKIPPTIADTDIQIEDTETPIDETVEEPAPYKPDLFIYSGKKPSTLSKSLGTTLQSSYAPSSPTTGLTTERGAGEIEGESGINRKNVWNEESLRLKDALGL